jgi:tetratricopeptide (TPR) repeat protein
MDYYQKLFNETRPQKTDQIIIIKSEDINNMTESEWVKNLFRGINSYKLKDYSNAIRFLDKAIQENSANQHLFQVRANIKEDSGDTIGAINDYKKALYISGRDWYAIYNQIAINYLNRKEFKNALKAFDISIELKNKLNK